MGPALRGQPVQRLRWLPPRRRSLLLDFAVESEGRQSWPYGSTTLKANSERLPIGSEKVYNGGTVDAAPTV